MTATSNRIAAILVSFVILAIALVLTSRFSPSITSAAGLTFSASTTVSFTGDSWTIVASSTASSVAVGTSNMIVTLSPTDSFTVHVTNKSFTATGQSADATLGNSLCYTDFGDHIGKLTITANNQTETVTVASTTCGQYDFGKARRDTTTLNIALVPAAPTPTATTTIPALPTLPATPTTSDLQLFLTGLAEQLTLVNKINVTSPDALKILEQIRLALDQALIKIAVAGGEVVMPPSGSYTANLYQGTSGDEVNSLQTFLKVQGTEIYPEGLVTGYFGPLTRAAVGRFQIKYGIVSDEDDPDYGYVGLGTREKINFLLGL